MVSLPSRAAPLLLLFFNVCVSTTLSQAAETASHTTQPTTTTTTSSGGDWDACAREDCYGMSCDEWVVHHGIQCDELEGYGCTCQDCECTVPEVTTIDSTSPSSTDGTATQTTLLDTCAFSDCIRGQSCDRLESLSSFNYTCSQLEAEQECDCSGCSCVYDQARIGGTNNDDDSSSDDGDSCAVSDCLRGHSCDFLVQESAVNFTCYLLETFYYCDCSMCACPDEPDPTYYCQTGNTSTYVKCPGVESFLLSSQAECEAQAGSREYRFYTWSEEKLRCQLMNSVDDDEGKCHYSDLSQFLLYRTHSSPCNPGFNDDGDDSDEIDLPFFSSNATTEQPCDQDCFDRFDYEYSEENICESAIEDGFSCEEYFCPENSTSGHTCLYAGYCNQACGYCQGGCTVTRTKACTDALDGHYGEGTCANLLQNGEYSCERQFCRDSGQTCPYAGYCDLTCGYCAERSCVDMPSFRDKEGATCNEYYKYKWCASEGQASLGWDTRWGTLQSWANSDGVSAIDACCACGGGEPCKDEDSDGLCFDVDSCPFDAQNDEDSDQLCSSVDSCPQSALNACYDDGSPLCPDEYVYGRGANVDIDSDVLKNTIALNVRTCGALCDSTTNCVAIMFSAATLTCRLLRVYHYVPPVDNYNAADVISDGVEYVCSLESTSLKVSGFSELTVAQSSSGACRQYSKNVLYVSKDTYMQVDVTDKQQCATACLDETDCLAFQFSDINFECQLWFVEPETVYALKSYHCFIRQYTTTLPSTQTQASASVVLGDPAGPFAVFANGECSSSNGMQWNPIDSLPYCDAAADAVGATVVREWNTSNPTDCYFDVANDEIRFNFENTDPSSQRVETAEARLQFCALEGAYQVPSPEPTNLRHPSPDLTTSTAKTMECAWSTETLDKYLSGCTEDFCYPYRSLEDAQAACEALGTASCGGVSEFMASTGGTQYETRSDTQLRDSKAAIASWLYSCDAADANCAPNCFGFSCDDLEDMQNSYTCASLEDDYGCDCSNCDCTADSPSKCLATCFGNSCDEWVSRVGYSCTVLENEFSCSCGGCICAM